MVACVVLGDSIAVGIGQARPECVSVAQSGITSLHYLQTRFHPWQAQTIVISLGVNDGPSAHTLDNLRTLRAGLRAREVVWMLPNLKPPVRAAIRAVAAANGDRLVDTAPMVGPDHLHPTGSGYRRLAAMTGGAAFTDVKPARAIMRDAHAEDQAAP